ncbi:SAM-dependent methyltransferase [Amycolatopsis sp. NPDC054798]
MSTSTIPTDAQITLARNEFERRAYLSYETKRDDTINLDLGHADGFYHHHFAVGDFDRSILSLPGHPRERAVQAEIHRMETRQVDLFIEALAPVAEDARILDGGSGRGGTSLLLHRAFGCQVDGINFCAHHNEFARAQAVKHGCADSVRFHDRNMVDTGLPPESFDYVVTNETTMYLDPLIDGFTEFARLLKPGGRYVLVTWCHDDAVAATSPEVAAIDKHYDCHTHRRSTYLRRLRDANLHPYQVDDLTTAAIPYWELRVESELATGVETAFLDGYRSGRLGYIRIVSRKGV